MKIRIITPFKYEPRLFLPGSVGRRHERRLSVAPDQPHSRRVRDPRPASNARFMHVLFMHPNSSSESLYVFVSTVFTTCSHCKLFMSKYKSLELKRFLS